MLAAEDAAKDIRLYINSLGGSIDARPGELRHHAGDPLRCDDDLYGAGRLDVPVLALFDGAGRFHTGQTIGRIEADSNRDPWFNAVEAKD